MSVKEILIALEQCRKHLARFERERNWICAADEASVMLKLYRDLLVDEKLEQQFEANGRR
jgi:hypothetical protein